ncbi:hypothetical protein RVS57_006268 [Pseudomonas aeruginosa]|uniref:Phage protein n=3 Tax=Pbunavirus TaxID=1198980 RepID=A0A6M4ESY7_9CAUD|nr:phage protein [Pseudomonas phage R26]ELK4888585.1 hypothetical protein [Pseudomonas aeruginosa]QJQ84991.1 hypothetical protein Epa6_gp88 [Pseudomonas phage Epa6]BBJ26758.1 phage protein [Pseudomonas phage R26]
MSGHSMFDFEVDFNSATNSATMEIDPGSFYVGFGFGAAALSVLIYVDGVWVSERTAWIPDPKEISP